MAFKSHMETALAEARAAAERGEVPVGAVIVSESGTILAQAGNRTRELNDPTAHAEILAIRAACTDAGSGTMTGDDRRPSGVAEASSPASSTCTSSGKMR